jgi:acetolactate synthase I/II/III large subunit
MVMGNLMHVNNGAEGFVETLNSLGVDHIFVNPGIDVVPILGAIASFRAKGRKAPSVILSTHESVAVAAAHGYAMVSGKAQVVILFQDVGTIQGGGSIINLQYGRIPVILAAGRNVATPALN